MAVPRIPKSRNDLLTEMAPDVERLYNRHLEAPRLWFPHEQIDWGQGENFADLICYVSFQERATQIAHRNTGAHLPKSDKIGRNVLALVAGDETKHYLFYRDLALAAFAIDPSTMMIAAAKQVSAFAMPGTGIPNFTRHAVRIAREGIYGLGQFLRDVLDPVLGLWDVGHLEGLSAEAERARQDLAVFVEKVSQSVERMAQKAAGVTPALS